MRLRQFSPPADGLVDLSLGDTAPSDWHVGLPPHEQDQGDDIREVLDSEYFVRPL